MRPTKNDARRTVRSDCPQNSPAEFKMRIPFRPAVLSAGLWMKDVFTHVCPRLGTRIFTAALFVRAEDWKEPSVHHQKTRNNRRREHGEEEGKRKQRKQSRNFMSLFYVNQAPCFVLGLSQSLELELSSRNKVKVGCLSPTSYQG